jgi:hypothetical protein
LDDPSWQVDLPLWRHCSPCFDSELTGSRPSPQLRPCVMVLWVILMFLLLNMGVCFLTMAISNWHTVVSELVTAMLSVKRTAHIMACSYVC